MISYSTEISNVIHGSYLNLIHCFKIQWSLYVPPVKIQISALYLQQISVSSAPYTHSNFYLKQHFFFFFLKNFLWQELHKYTHKHTHKHIHSLNLSLSLTHTHTHTRACMHMDKRSGSCRRNLSLFKGTFVGLIYIDITKHTYIRTFTVMVMMSKINVFFLQFYVSI